MKYCTLGDEKYGILWDEQHRILGDEKYCVLGDEVVYMYQGKEGVYFVFPHAHRVL